MKHNIRQRVINEYGLPVVKVETIQGELGSGIFDKNGKEIFEGDVVKKECTGKTHSVYFVDGGFMIHDWTGYHLLTNFPEPLEVVGHVEDK